MRCSNSFMHFCLQALFCGALSSLNAQAQHLTGVVHDRQTGQPIRGTSIVVDQIRTTTDAAGRFGMATPGGFPITVTATHVGYEPVSIRLYAPPDTLLRIFLSGKTIGLDEVTVLGRRNSVKDSLWMRREYADQFGFKPVKPWQALTVSPVGIGINLNVLFASFSREQKHSKLLKAALIRDEREDYVDRRFTKALIQAQTKIPDEELDVFHWYFRPSYDQLLGFTEYDLLRYIQQHYRDFRSRRHEYPKRVPVLDAHP